MLRTSLDAENEENVSGRIAQNSTQGSITQCTCAVTLMGWSREGHQNIGLALFVEFGYRSRYRIDRNCQPFVEKKKNKQKKERKKMKADEENKYLIK